MKRREFIALVGSAVACPLAARAQLSPSERTSQPVMPVIGFLNNMWPEAWQPAMTGFRQGLSEAGFAEGRNVAFEYRWTDGKRDLLPELAADLIRSGVALIVASADSPTALAAMAAAPHNPVVFLRRSRHRAAPRESAVRRFGRFSARRTAAAAGSLYSG
jgi:putative tryptophan/tyrosine transport system substrate-binding protein